MSKQARSSLSTLPSLDLSYWHILGIIGPVLIANLAMPLQGAIDVAVVGHFDHAYNLAGLGIASQLWLLVLVSFNFLQYASSGLAAQAVGKVQNPAELGDILYRSIGLALLLGLLLWVFKTPIIHYGLHLLSAEDNSRQAATEYLSTRYLGIVFELMNYALIGWFAGQGKTKQMMLIQVLISLINIVTTLGLVYALGMGIKGVALGTVMGYAIGCSFAYYLARRHIAEHKKTLDSVPSITNSPIKNSIANPFKALKLRFKQIYQLDKMLRLFSLNKDIFIRTILLTLSFAWITRLSAQQGDVIMATNALLLQVLSISAFALDGVAVAAESLSGRTLTRQSTSEFKTAIQRTGTITAILAILISLLWWLLLPTFLNLMTDIDTIYQLALSYKYLAIFLPLAGAGAYWLDGVMFGLTAGKKIRQVALIVAGIFFPLTWAVYTAYGDTYPMAVIWFGVYWLLLSRFIVAALTLRRGYLQGGLLGMG